jgi:hypothetical protein
MPPTSYAELSSHDGAIRRFLLLGKIKKPKGPRVRAILAQIARLNARMT